MIPAVSDTLQKDFVFEEPPTNTFKLNVGSSTINGFVDELEAMKQAIYLILNIERYEYIIYSWNYGVELQDLFGQPTSFVLPELKRRITEALMQDSRITEVSAFSFDKNKEKINVSFTVATIFGSIQAEKVVTV